VARPAGAAALVLVESVVPLHPEEGLTRIVAPPARSGDDRCRQLHPTVPRDDLNRPSPTARRARPAPSGRASTPHRLLRARHGHALAVPRAASRSSVHSKSARCSPPPPWHRVTGRPPRRSAPSGCQPACRRARAGPRPNAAHCRQVGEGGRRGLEQLCRRVPSRWRSRIMTNRPPRGGVRRAIRHT